RPVVLGRLPAEAEKVVRAVAANRGAPVHSVAERFASDVAVYPETNLEGDYQRWNPATETLAVQRLAARGLISGEAVTRGLARVEWAGRWERMEVDGRSLILDASHNPEGAQVLDDNLARLVADTGRTPIVLMGALG